jgi:GntR family transcriptional regulator/MocR family aminotransferase
MNIPDDALQALLRPALAERAGLTRQRALYMALRDAIRGGTLKAHSLLPGSRVLAKTLAVSRNTVNAALEQLAIEGFVQRERQGTRVLMLASAPVVRNTPVISLAQRVRTLPQGVKRNSPHLLSPRSTGGELFPHGNLAKAE